LNLNASERIYKAIREDVVSGRTGFDLGLAQALIDRKRDTPGATLPILHDLQEQFGYIDDAAIPLIAEALNISRAETLGVISFYHDFHRAPVDGRVLKLCRAESCQSTGCEELVSHLELRHGIKVDDEDKYSGLHVETVYCLGNCALSPAASLDGAPVGRLDRDRIDAIVAAAQGKTQ
jgi:formate dehydrogenase subunit gamma